MLRLAVFASLCLAAASLSLAESGAIDEQHAGHAAGSFGTVHLAISCSAAQPDFDRALAMLHSFWYEKAQQNFSTITQRDPACAMAWWGVAMTYWHPLWDRPDAQALAYGREALTHASGASESSPRERALIDALNTFYTTGGEYLARARAYEQAMAGVHAAYPADGESGAFYALALLATAQASPPDKTYAREKEAAQLLNGVLKREPRHPGALHYLIHAYDSPPLAHYALAAARTYARVAPAVPHAQHMPSHIFVRLGLWQEAIASNLAAEAAAKRFAAEMRLRDAWDEQLHAMDYLEYAYLQRGDDHQAAKVFDALRAIKRTSPENFKVAYAYAAIPARYAIERQQWVEAAALKQEHPDFPWPRFPWAQAITEFARGLGAARSGDTTRAQASAGHLRALQTVLEHDGDRYWAMQVQIQRLAVVAWLAHAQHDDESAMKWMQQSADLEDASEKRPVTPGPIVPARELLGNLLLELKQPAAAQAAFETTLVSAPDRFNALLGAARAARAAGDARTARKHYRRLLVIAAPDAQRPALQEARGFLRATNAPMKRTE